MRFRFDWDEFRGNDVSLIIIVNDNGSAGGDLEESQVRKGLTNVLNNGSERYVTLSGPEPSIGSSSP